MARSAGSWGRYMSFQHQNVCVCITIEMIVIKKITVMLVLVTWEHVKVGKKKTGFKAKLYLHVCKKSLQVSYWDYRWFFSPFILCTIKMHIIIEFLNSHVSLKRKFCDFEKATTGWMTESWVCVYVCTYIYTPSILQNIVATKWIKYSSSHQKACS